MKTENLIPLNKLCVQYKVEMSFFDQLNEYDLIEIRTVERSPHIHEDEIRGLEKIVRLHRELDINIEGIDTVFNLLQKIHALEDELNELKNRLSLYEKL